MRYLLAILVLLSILLPRGTAHATRIQELCDIQGVRPNQLIGYGLVVGLNGTGDRQQSRFTPQSVAAMLSRLGTAIDARSLQTRNVAAVMVTSTLPPFANPGQRIDVTVSSIGDAKSLVGGTLLQTPLIAGNRRRVYAVAQGALLVGGFSAEGSSGSSVSLNHVTVGRIPAGAIVERRVGAKGLDGRALVLTMKSPSFVTAQRIVKAINARFGAGTANATDPATIRLTRPTEMAHAVVEFISEVQQLRVDADSPVRVVVDERTGTVVLGAGVEIAEVAVAQGGLTVQIEEKPAVSQPEPLGAGQTTVVPDSTVEVDVGKGALRKIEKSATLTEVIAALNALGARPRDLLAIFQALRTAGALRADIEVQ